MISRLTHLQDKQSLHARSQWNSTNFDGMLMCVVRRNGSSQMEILKQKYLFNNYQTYHNTATANIFKAEIMFI